MYTQAAAPIAPPVASHPSHRPQRRRASLIHESRWNVAQTVAIKKILEKPPLDPEIDLAALGPRKAPLPEPDPLAPSEQPALSVDATAEQGEWQAVA